ncbi:unnamed protein product, partial [Porites lobata]
MRVADIFLYLNSVANPLIYCYRDRRFRNAVLEILKSRRPKEKPSVVTDAARFGDVKHNDVFGSGKDTLQMQKVKNQVRLTRSASCDLTRPVDRAYIDSHKILLTRTKSSLSVFYCPHEPHLVWDSHDTTSPWVFAAFASIVSPAAVLLNALIIIAVKQRKELQRTSNILLTSLAVTDLLVGSLCIPLSAVVKLLVPHQVLADHYICMLDFVAISSTITLAICSIFHLTVIAWERYVAIRKWIDYKVMVTKSLMKKLAIIAWVLAIVTVSPPNFITALKGMMRANEAVIALEIFLIPLSLLLMSALSLIVYFYVMVYLGVRKRKISQIRQVSELVKVKQERRIAMTAAVVTITLILSFLPSILGGMLQGIYLFFRQRLAMRVEDIFLYLNSVANPLIYCYRDRRFRNAVLDILKSRRPKEKPSV